MADYPVLTNEGMGRINLVRHHGCGNVGDGTMLANALYNNMTAASYEGLYKRLMELPPFEISKQEKESNMFDIEKCWNRDSQVALGVNHPRQSFVVLSKQKDKQGYYPVYIKSENRYAVCHEEYLMNIPQKRRKAVFTQRYNPKESWVFDEEDKEFHEGPSPVLKKDFIRTEIEVEIDG